MQEEENKNVGRLITSLCIKSASTLVFMVASWLHLTIYLLLPIYYHILRACNYIFLQNLCILLFKFYVWSCLKYQDINNKAKTYFSCAVVMLCFYKVALSNVVSIAYYAWQCTLCWHNVIGIIKSYLHYDAS